jgi:septin family protein
MFIEALRRTQWALIRIENENVNNFERYRTVLQIPEFKDMVYDNNNGGDGGEEDRSRSRK